MEPSFQYRSITNKDMIIIKKDRVCISWIDSALWNACNILMHITLIKRKGKKKERKKLVFLFGICTI